MLPYWILFAVWAAGTVQFNRSNDAARNNLLLWFAAAATALMIGLRFQVGNDWGTYERIFNDVAVLNFRQTLAGGDPAYTTLCLLAARLGLGIASVNVVCGALFMWGLGRLARRQANPWLAVLVGVPYFIIVVAMGYTRQATAIGVIMAGLAVASERTVLRTVLYIVAAAAFHKTAVLALPVIGVAALRRQPVAAVIGAVVFMGAYLFFLSASVDNLVTNYVTSDYDSQGAAVRVSMDALAALVFFMFRKSMNFTPFERAIWGTFAYLSVASLAALFVLSATSGIDRIALFLIPLQIVAFSRLPYLAGWDRPANPQLMLAVVGYSLAVQFTWLNYADNAYGWVPYRATLFSDPDE